MTLTVSGRRRVRLPPMFWVCSQLGKLLLSRRADPSVVASALASYVARCTAQGAVVPMCDAAAARAMYARVLESEVARRVHGWYRDGAIGLPRLLAMDAFAQLPTDVVEAAACHKARRFARRLARVLAEVRAGRRAVRETAEANALVREALVEPS